MLKAAQHADLLRDNCLQNRQSVAFETVFSSPQKVNYVRKAIEAGFFVRLFFMGTNSPIINVNRVGLRVAEGGHSVPIQKIISRYSKSIANLGNILQEVHRGYVYDNSVDDQFPKIQFRTEFGHLNKTYQSDHNWADKVRTSLQVSPKEY